MAGSQIHVPAMAKACGVCGDGGGRDTIYTIMSLIASPMSQFNSSCTRELLSLAHIWAGSALDPWLDIRSTFQPYSQGPAAWI